MNPVANAIVAGSSWDDDEPPKKLKKKLLNGRYLKIKKLGQGSFNTVYLAEDLYPQSNSRILTKEQLELISQIPESEMNPYRKANFGYFNEGEEEEQMDPDLRQKLQINNDFMPQNGQFEDQKQEQEGEPQVKKKCLVAIKKQRNISQLEGLEFTLLREIKLLQELDHVNIVKLHDVFHIQNLLYFALEYGALDVEELIFKYTDQKQPGKESDVDPIVLEAKHIKCIFK